MHTNRTIFACQSPFSLEAKSNQLAGLSLGVKDLFDMAGLPTAAGNPDWLRTHETPKATASVVLRLLEAGAEFIGKTQTDEIAYSLNGTNQHYGTPLNPAAPERIPGGSSSGSAVAVANGSIDIGLGTDTGGSIRVPASYNGLFGLRTTHGLVPLDNTVPLSPMFDTVGWMTRDIDTMQKVSSCLLSEQKVTTYQSVAVLVPEVNGVTLWRPEHQAWLDKQSSVTQVNIVRLNHEWLAGASECFRTLQGYTLWQQHQAWITQYQPTFAPDIKQRLDWCQSLSIAEYQQALSQQQQFIADIESWFAKVDCIVMPTTPSAAPKLNASADWMANYRSELMGLTAPAGLAGLPQLHLPVLTDEQAPFGLSLLGKKYSELSLIHLAKSLSANVSVFSGEGV